MPNRICPSKICVTAHPLVVQARAREPEMEPQSSQRPQREATLNRQESADTWPIPGVRGVLGGSISILCALCGLCGSNLVVPRRPAELFVQRAAVEIDLLPGELAGRRIP